MLRSSILGRLCGPLCDAVVERIGSAELLSALSRTNLFLVPLDDRGRWYRFHHLFARLLRVELEHREPGAAPALHRRAYAWHRDHGSIDEAMEHALQAGAFREAGELVATWHFPYAGLGRYATVLGWLQRLPGELVRESAQLLLVEAWISSGLGRQDEAAQAIAAVEQYGRLDEGPLPDGFSSLESSLTTLRAMFSWGDIGAAYASATRAVELEDPHSPRRDVVCSALGYALYFRGESDEADRWLAEAARLAQAQAHPTVASYSLAYRSFIAGDQGRIDEQMQLAEAAAAVAAEHGLEDVLGDVLLAVGLSRAARAQLEEGIVFLERGIAITRAWSQPQELVHQLIQQATLLRASGANEAAGEAIAEARAIVDSCADLGILGERLAALECSSKAHRRASVQGSELSDRELVVVRMLGGPLSERDIGRELYLSHNTIHSHTRSIYRKLGVSSRPAAVQKARELGLI